MCKVQIGWHTSPCIHVYLMYCDPVVYRAQRHWCSAGVAPCWVYCDLVHTASVPSTQTATDLKDQLEQANVTVEVFDSFDGDSNPRDKLERIKVNIEAM